MMWTFNEIRGVIDKPLCRRKNIRRKLQYPN